MLRYLLFYFILCSSVIAQTLTFGSKNIITNSFDSSKRIKVIDYNKDGLLDIIAASSKQDTIDDNIAWFENTGSGFTQHSIAKKFQGARTIDVGDLNDDGLLDIIGASRLSDPISWWENQSYSTWVLHTEPSSCDTSHVVKAADVNDDGYLDLVAGVGMWPNSSSTFCIGWYENDSENPGNFTFHEISNNWQNVINLEVVDLDQDGDKDIIGVDVGVGDDIANDGVIWLENDGSENFTEREIDFSSLNPMYIYSGDIDNDNDIDILTVNWPLNDPPDRSEENNIFCYENDGKAGSDPTKTWTKYLISDNFFSARSGLFYDLNGDGNLDILGAACDQYSLGNGGYISYWINDGTPFNGGWTRTDIITNFTYAYHAVAEDMDDDGDLDIFGSAQDAGDISWWENQISDDVTNITTNTDYNLWNSKVRVNFSSGPSGTEYTKAFFNSGAVPNRQALGSGINNISIDGYFTLKTDESNYTQDLQFHYGSITTWDGIIDENDLIMCYWNGSQWIAHADQSVNTTVDSILIRDFSQTNSDAILWTLGSTTSDNPLPVNLIFFKANLLDEGIELNWETGSELNNAGFELWRKSKSDNDFQLLTSYKDNDALEGLGTSSIGKLYSFVDKDVLFGESYDYKIIDVSYSGTVKENKQINVVYTKDNLIRVENRLLPNKLSLYQNYPNPFNNKSIIEFSIPDELNGQNIFLEIYNELGQKIKTLYNSYLSSGNYSIIWDGTNDKGKAVSSGMYLYMIKTDNQFYVKRMILLK